MKVRLIFPLALCVGLFGCPQDPPKTGTNPNAGTPLGTPTSQPAQQAQQPAQQPAEQPAQQPAEPAQPAQGGEAVAAAGNAADGKRLYMTGCANCHGPDGTGAMMRAMLPKIGDLTSAEMHGRMKDEDIAALIKTGRDKMPPFGGVFKDHQIQSIVAYVRTLKKG